MKIAITFEGEYLVLPADKAQPLIEALAAGQLYTRKGYSDDEAEYTPAEAGRKAKVLFVSEDQFQAPLEPFKKLQEEVSLSNRRWLEAYQERNKALARVKELEAKLQSINVVVDIKGGTE
jgi:hypothetical protein